MDDFLKAAIDEAKAGFAEGGISIGSVLVIDGRIVGRGHNRRVQKEACTRKIWGTIHTNKTLSLC